MPEVSTATDISTIINIVLTILSFVLALFSIIILIITLRQNQKTLALMEKQITEMQETRQLSTQPIIKLNKENFIIHQPNLFHNHDRTKCSFFSKCFFETTLLNISSSTAICIDIIAEIILPSIEQYTLNDIERYNILPQNEESYKLSLMFNEYEQLLLFYNSIREKKSILLPKLKVSLLYKNTCGGYFICENTYIIFPNNKDINLIKKWHTLISSFNVIYKDEIEQLKKETNETNWYNLFSRLQNILTTKIKANNLKEIKLLLRECPEEYDFQIISKNEYEEMTQNNTYGQFIHLEPHCDYNEN